jgi:hypothetical protein
MKEQYNYTHFTMNNIVLQMIPGEHNFGFHRRTGGTCRASQVSLTPQFCRPNDFALEKLDVWWGKHDYHEHDMDERLISLMPVEDMGA